MTLAFICPNCLALLCSCTKKPKGRARKELDGKVKKIHVHEGQVKSVRELLKEVEFMRDEIEEWKAK